MYDFPVNTNSQLWNNSTALIVVCGNVPANLTSQLLQYLVTGGQLLCLCSDLLYSVLHIFSTAEVRKELSFVIIFNVQFRKKDYI